MEDLIAISKHECEVAQIWFRSNKIIVNPYTFEAILINKSKSLYVQEAMSTGNDEIESFSNKNRRQIEF